MYRSKETLQQAPLNKRKESYGPGPTERRDTTTIAGCPNGKTYLTPNPKGLQGRAGRGRTVPSNRRAADFRNIQGGRAILPWNTVTTMGCDRRANRGRGRRRRGEPPGEESHSAEGVPATADRPKADRTKLPLLSRGP